MNSTVVVGPSRSLPCTVPLKNTCGLLKLLPSVTIVCMQSSSPHPGVDGNPYNSYAVVMVMMCLHVFSISFSSE